MKLVITLLAAVCLAPVASAGLSVDSAKVVKPEGNTGLPAPKITETLCAVKGSNPVRKVACLVFETKDRKLCRPAKSGFAPGPELICP